ncbi:hypothetical protein JB92DRAFT_2926320 [Gautieria morchelliformis]|nr:hypothetical protein JB92DRAFT_2926320 [Gautieria morchelliformis]
MRLIQPHRLFHHLPRSTMQHASLESMSNTAAIAGCASRAVGFIVMLILGYFWWRGRRRESHWQKYKTAMLERDTGQPFA